LVWIVFLLLLSVFTKNEVRKKRSLLLSLFFVFLFCNTFFVNEVNILFEKKAIQPIAEKYDVGIVLGGFSKFDSTLNRPVFFEANDRLMQALVLLKNGTIKKLLISGGSASLLGKKEKEADVVAQYLKSLKISDSLIIVENKSRNTIENIENSFHILDSLKIKGRPLIISSAWHLPRVKLCVRERDADYFPCNFMSDQSRKYEWTDYFMPSSVALYHFELLIKETVGYVFYYLKTI